MSTDARLLHRLLGLTVLQVSTGQEAKGDNAFELDAVSAAEVAQLRAIARRAENPQLAGPQPARAGNRSAQVDSPGRQQIR